MTTTGRRVLVTGSRDWTDTTTIAAVLRRWRTPGAVLVHGGARGADRIAAAIWRAWGLPTEQHRADWDRHGNAAGYIRNQHMVTAGATVCLAFILDNSRGATHCAQIAETAGIPTHRIERTSSTGRTVR
jgi:hypothetical protein